MKEFDEWPHPERCPSTECRGQFFLLRNYGIVCSVVLEQGGREFVEMTQRVTLPAIVTREGAGL